jgi:hypothetical protein
MFQALTIALFQVFSLATQPSTAAVGGSGWGGGDATAAVGGSGWGGGDATAVVGGSGWGGGDATVIA